MRLEKLGLFCTTAPAVLSSRQARAAYVKTSDRRRVPGNIESNGIRTRDGEVEARPQELRKFAFGVTGLSTF